MGYAAQVPTGPGSVPNWQRSTSEVPWVAFLRSTLAAALTGKLNPDVNLVGTLNGADFAVIAPVDEALAKLPPATADTLRSSLVQRCRYHVIGAHLGGQEASVFRNPHNREWPVGNRDGQRRRPGGHGACVVFGGIRRPMQPSI